jgi:WD40 repeat protein
MAVEETPVPTDTPVQGIRPTDIPYTEPAPTVPSSRLDNGEFIQVAVSPHGDQFVVGTNIGCYFFDMETLEILRFIPTELPIWSMAISPDGESLATALRAEPINDRNPILLWDIRDGKQIGEFDGHMEWVNALAFTPDGTTLISASRDDSLAIWDVHTGERLQTLQTPKEARHPIMVSVTVSSDGTRMASGAHSNEVFIWDLNTYETLYTLSGSASITFAPEGNRLATASCEHQTWGVVTLWEDQKPIIYFEADDYTACALSVDFSPDGKQLVSSYRDGSFIVWDTEWGDRLYTHENKKEPVHFAVFSPDGVRLLTWSYEGVIFIRDTQTWELIGEL